MGKMIRCNGSAAKKPYHFRLTDTNVYSVEEVCYYIRHNIYVVQEEIFDREFILWLRDELKMEQTAQKLENLIKDHHDIKDIVVTICCSCDYYDESQINELIRIMDDMKKLPAYARRKVKGDNYMRGNSYEKALEEYEKIFESDEILQADPSVYGDIFHNMGVACAKIGEFHKAAEYFLQAYEKNRREESLSQGFYALLLGKDTEGTDRALEHYEIPKEKFREWNLTYLTQMEKAKSGKTVQQMERLSELLKNGAIDEYYEKVHDYITGWKDEYRKQIRV